MKYTKQRKLLSVLLIPFTLRGDSELMSRTFAKRPIMELYDMICFAFLAIFIECVCYLNTHTHKFSPEFLRKIRRCLYFTVVFYSISTVCLVMEASVVIKIIHVLVIGYTI